MPKSDLARSRGRPAGKLRAPEVDPPPELPVDRADPGAVRRSGA